MNKTIGGKKYDPEKSEMLAEYDNGYPRNDFHYYEEKLYRRTTGEYFLYGSGGANSKYGVWHGNSGGLGEKITPLSITAAQAWVENACDGDEYERIFGTVEEKKVLVSIWISKDDKIAAEELKASRKSTLADIFAAGIKALKAEE